MEDGQSVLRFSISLELLDLIQEEGSSEEIDKIIETITNDNISGDFCVLALKEMVLKLHKTLALPRASRFIKNMLNILAMTEDSQSPTGRRNITQPSNLSVSGEYTGDVKSTRWRQLQQEQQQMISGRLRKSKHFKIGASESEIEFTGIPEEVIDSDTPSTPSSPIREYPKQIDEGKVQMELKLQDALQADGPNTDVWEAKMRPPVTTGVNQIGVPENLYGVSSTNISSEKPVQSNESLKKKKQKMKRKAVPYAEHQVMLPSNFFRYPVMDTQFLEQEHFRNVAPVRIPSWFGISIHSGTSLKLDNLVTVPFNQATIVFNSHGRLLPLLETCICQALFRLFANYFNSNEELSSFINYVTLVKNQFPWFTNSTGEDFDSPCLTKAEQNLSLLIESIREIKWDESKYINYVEQFIYFRGDPEKLKSLVLSVEKDLLDAICYNDSETIEKIERILISFLGHSQDFVRDRATILLNCLYDKHIWQLQFPFNPKIREIGDAFTIEIPINAADISENIMEQLIVAVSLSNGSEYPEISYHVPTVFGSSLIVELTSFKSAGYYDWALGFISSEGLKFISFSHTNLKDTQWSIFDDKSKDTHGRFIVQPKIRRDIIHEVFVDIEGAIWDRNNGGPIRRHGTFGTITLALDDYVNNDGITTIYIMGAHERSEFGRGHPFSPINRATPNAASGGLNQFNELMEAAKERGLKIYVDATARISMLGSHRKYRGLNCQTLDLNGMPQVSVATDGAEQVWKESQLLNYRKKKVWDLYIQDVIEWAKLGVHGIRIESAHCCPLILRPDIKELERMDSDGQFHYELQEILDGDIVLPSNDESFTYGYYGTKSYNNGYPNPFFIKLTSNIWKEFPEFSFTAETYWNRHRNAIISGLVPYSTGLSQALTSVFGTGIQKTGTIGKLGRRRDVKAFYDWYEMERTGYPQNSIIIYASSNHYSPYPVSLFGRGAWSAVDLLFFLPEIPQTYVGEHGGWSMEYDLSSKSFRRLAIDHQYSALSEIRGHYVHRASMRKNIKVLNDGGLILLYAKVNSNVWHDRVFAFARFKLRQMAIIAINFNDVESTFYIDFSPLKNLFATQDMIYKRVDYINPQIPPMYFSLDELLNEKQQVTLQPYKSMCWGIITEIDSPAARRVLFEHSFNRLADNLENGVDPSYNLVYSDFFKSFKQSIEKFDYFIKSFTQQLPPTSLNRFPTLIRNALALSASSLAEESKLIATLEYLKLKVELENKKNNSNIINVYKQILECNTLGPIVFVTPEIGRFSKVGGIAVMVDELTQALVSLGCEVIVISPYYNFDRKGSTGYLKKEGVKQHSENIIAYVGHEPVEVGVHSLKENGVQYYFIHHFDYFPTPYHAGTSMHQLKTIVLMAKASLELLCQLRILPGLIISNDWFTGLVPAYGRKSSAFGTTFDGVTFFHLVHNLEEGYEGKIYLDGSDHLGYIHHLPREIVVDPTCHQLCLNASRCALLSCNQWGTVSISYRADLMGGSNPSPLGYYLSRFSEPFAYSNGIRVNQRQELLDNTAKNHDEAKKILQEKYFGKEDSSIPLFSFVGRICLQKGVHLILNAVRELIDTHKGKLQIIVGGMANYKDPYAAQCAWTMQGLRGTYSNVFWADPNEFFTDGPLLNLGSDFALMPSLFEPSGVVQQEYFLGGTPVIAFKTGGLKDTVFEGVNGNGFTFEAHTHKDYIDAVGRAIHIFNNQEEYKKLRQRAKDSVLDMEVVAQAWAKEFSRLRKCIWVNQNDMKKEYQKLLEQYPLELNDNEKTE